jgi:hypothetical protein
MKTIIIPDIDVLMNDRQCFNDFVYTDIAQAEHELHSRQGNGAIAHFIEANLPSGIPSAFKHEKNAVLARQLATPNFEFMQFSAIADGLSGFNKLVMEMHKDKFTPADNLTKYHLARLIFREAGPGRANRSLTTVDFNEHAGKPISEVKTRWGQNLVEFHADLMQQAIGKKLITPTASFEASAWVSTLGRSADVFYSKFLCLFLQHGILFENFLLKEKAERRFTKEVFLPAFIKITRETGIKPLIVSYLPFETEGNDVWNHYPAGYFNFVNNNLEKAGMMQCYIAA